MTASAPQPAPLRLLIVDDHEDSARALSRLFRHEGHLVITAHTVAGALALVAGQLPIDVLISDIGLPDGDGCELLRRLRALYGGRDVRAVALSGMGEEPFIEACKRAGYGEFLVKPVTFDQILAAILAICPGAAARSADPRDQTPALGGVPAPLVD